MAPLRKDRLAKPKPSIGKANAIGYSQRQLRKANARSNLDVYEHRTEKVRRSKVALELDRDELVDLRLADGDGSEAEQHRARLVGVNGEDEKIDIGDDEEIDSDVAFEETDEERYAGFDFSSKKTKSSARNSSKGSGVRFVDLNEDDVVDGEELLSVNNDDEEEEEEESGDADEFIDVLDVLDGRGEIDDSSDEKPESQNSMTLHGQAPSLEEDEEEGAEEGDAGEGRSDDGSEIDRSDSEESIDEESNAFSVSDAEEVAPAALEHLESFISKLDAGAKRKEPHTGAVDGSPRPIKRRTVKEQTEAGEEKQFISRASGSKLRLEDLLAPLGTQTANALSLKKTTKVLAASSSSKPLDVPLPHRTQERLDREAAYEQTKGEVDKWSATMKRIKEAEHLSFPLQAQAVGNTSNLELNAKFRPTTELESSVDKLLKSAKMREEDIHKTEELKMSHLSVEEVAARRGELRKMRDLMFRAEIKARRVAKIKSKAYRRIRKKQRGKLVDDTQEVDDEEERLKRETDRARERATLRHKNTGKWAKAMHGRGELDLDQRREISEMLERGERLREKIDGNASGQDEDDEDQEDSDDDVEGGIKRIKDGAFEEISQLSKPDPPLDEGSTQMASGLFSMKFMREGMAREQQRVDSMTDDFIREMGGAHDLDGDGEKVSGENLHGAAVVQRMGGRVAYRPGEELLSKPLKSLSSDTSSVTLQSADLVETTPTNSPVIERTMPISSARDSNPWLAPREVSFQGPKRNEVVVAKNSTTVEKLKNKLKKQANRVGEEKAKAREDAELEISMDAVMVLSSASTSVDTAAAPRQSKVGESHGVDEDEDDNSEVEDQETRLLKGKAKSRGPNAFEQRDLVALAFAGDNVVKDFEEAKKREIAADAPREVDTTLAGWGSWGGLGTRRAPTKPHLIKKVAGINPSARADFNKSHVIISEKRDKKAAKYLIKDLPYPYTSKAQFESSMERPIGTEWNTRVAFQRATLPKVIKKMGAIIDPLDKLF